MVDSIFIIEEGGTVMKDGYFLVIIDGRHL